VKLVLYEEKLSDWQEELIKVESKYNNSQEELLSIQSQVQVATSRADMFGTQSKSWTKNWLLWNKNYLFIP
jgi:chromosome segregation ATPase